MKKMVVLIKSSRNGLHHLLQQYIANDCKLVTKQLLLKAKYIIASNSSFAPLFSKIQATNTLGIGLDWSLSLKIKALKLKLPTLVDAAISTLYSSWSS